MSQWRSPAPPACLAIFPSFKKPARDLQGAALWAGFIPAFHVGWLAFLWGWLRTAGSELPETSSTRREKKKKVPQTFPFRPYFLLPLVAARPAGPKFFIS